TLPTRSGADREVNESSAAAGLVVLPYRRSSASGPLHIAMSHGLPVVVTAVGGLVEAGRAEPGVRVAPGGGVPGRGAGRLRGCRVRAAGRPRGPGRGDPVGGATDRPPAQRPVL